jgi:hypothetical protein
MTPRLTPLPVVWCPVGFAIAQGTRPEKQFE